MQINGPRYKKFRVFVVGLPAVNAPEMNRAVQGLPLMQRDTWLIQTTPYSLK